MKIIKSIDSLLNKIEGGILIFLLLLMLFMAFGQVVLRNFFSGGIVWGDIVLRHLVLWIGFLGATLAASGERHLNIDALTRYLPGRIRGVVATCSDVFAAVICFLLFRASITFIRFDIGNNNILFANVPSWCGEIIIPVGFGLLTVHFIIRAILHAGQALQKGSPA
ncbi:MAG: TRAP transporter small permease [Ignavibacteriae bacterium]|nr:MAG: TRAP transporter small permease [Ignavibacteriota bacterium]